jgi:hypothetical protein
MHFECIVYSDSTTRAGGQKARANGG